MAWEVKNLVQSHVAKQRLRSLQGAVVQVGIIGSRSGSDLVTYARANEFGVPGHIPERSFLRSTVREKRDRYGRLMSKAVADVLAGEPSVRAFEKVGVRVVRDVRLKITRLRIPPNAASTIRRKGSSNPLIDTGRMRQSITYVFRRADVVPPPPGGSIRGPRRVAGPKPVVPPPRRR